MEKVLDYVKQVTVGMVVGLILILLVKPFKLGVQKLKQMLPIKSKEGASK